jgi:ketosteroid isomerase-like protein
VIACRCLELELLQDVEADAYTDHLVQESVDDAGLVTYRCPSTARRWVSEFPDGPGGRVYQLRRLTTAVELVESLAEAGPEARLAATHPEVEFSLPDSPTTHRGLEAAERTFAAAAADPNPSRSSVVSMIEVSDDEVVVLASRSLLRDGAYTEHRPEAWLVTLRDGLIFRSLWFDSWQAAREAVGIPKDAAIKRVARSWLLAVHRAVRASVATPRRRSCATSGPALPPR